MQCVKCGSEYVLEEYHEQQRKGKHLDLCHSCYRALPKAHKLQQFDSVQFTVERYGFKPTNAAILARVTPGSVGSIVRIERDGRYMVACGGFLVWALPEHLKPCRTPKLDELKQLEPISVGDLILAQVRKDLEEYEKSHEMP